MTGYWRVFVLGGKASMFAVGYGVLGGGELPPNDGKGWMSSEEAKQLCEKINGPAPQEFPWQRKKDA